MKSLSSTAPSEKYSFYKSIGSPKFIVAPMVDQSELPYRMLTRKYKAQLCYTPMLHARLFSESETYRQQNFTPNPEDRPLAVQFCANDPNILLKAAQFVENDCDAVDINFGCPQGIAKKGKYGSFLLEKTDLIRQLVSILNQNLKIPVICKIRCLPTKKATLELAKVIEEAGASMLVVHGRTRDQKKNDIREANWTIIKEIKETLSIPVVANGGIVTYDDVIRCLEYTGCDGVMSSEAILEYPALFDNSQIHDLDQIALEYLQMVEQYKGEADQKVIKAHVHKFLHMGLKDHTDLRESLVNARTVEEVKKVVLEMKERRKEMKPQDKLGWYYRYWKSMSLDQHKTQTFTYENWDQFIERDPLYQKKVAKVSEQVKDNHKQDILDMEGGEELGLGALLNDEVSA